MNVLTLNKPQIIRFMKHRLFAIIMALPLVAIFAGACNEIETASIDSDVTKSRHITETTPSIQVSQSEANAIADMIMAPGIGQ